MVLSKNFLEINWEIVPILNSSKSSEACRTGSTNCNDESHFNIEVFPIFHFFLTCVKKYRQTFLSISDECINNVFTSENAIWVRLGHIKTC